VTSDKIRGFNRDTWWLATGVLGAVIFDALVLAVQEYHPAKVNPTEDAVQVGSDLLQNARVVTGGTEVAKSSNGHTGSGEGSGADHAIDQTSPLNGPSSQMEPAGTATSPVLEHTNLDSGIRASRQDYTQAIGTKTRNARNRSSVASRYVGVKRRLIELWHQSLAQNEKSRSWVAFSNLKTWANKKAAYTAATIH
jgi:hypothetical protein